jgi:DNA-binding CsgD family transcriptional regulator
MLKIDLCLVAEMRGEGKTYKEIGEELGVKPAQICQLMSDQDMVCKRAPIPTQKAKQYYQRMKEGKTYEEIGKEFGVTRQNVDLVLRYWYGQNIGKRYGKKGKGLDIAAMAQLKKQGWSNIQIADLFEIHPGYVYSLLKNVWGEHIGLGKRYSWDVYAGWALFEEGWTYKQIAEKYGKHMMTIANGIQRIRRRY